MRSRRFRRAMTGAVGAAAAALVPVCVAAGAQAAPEAAAQTQVQVHLTTTSDPGGRQVAKGLEKQDPVAFVPGGGGDITVDESTTYQTFEGGGASFTDTRRLAAEEQRRDQRGHPQRDHEEALRPCRGHRPRLRPQPDGRLRPRPFRLHLRRHARRADRPRPGRLLHRARPRRRAAADRPGACAQPGRQGDGLAVDRARLDEGQRQARPGHGWRRSTTGPTPSTS